MTREEQIKEAAEDYSAYRDATDEEDLYNSTELEAFKEGAEWADTHPAKKQAVTIDAWVAREGCGELHLYENKPNRYGYDSFVVSKGASIGLGAFTAGLFSSVNFPSVTFENSPKKAKITIELEEE